MEKVAILFGSSSGNTETVAETIANKIGSDNVELLNVADISASDVENYKNLILGSSTWGVGDLQDDWESFLPALASIDLNGKNVAIYGLGDAASYSDSFVDAMGTIYDKIKDKGIKLIGQVATDGYSFDESKAIYDGKFIGLPLDEDNESDQTESRIDGWVKEITPLFA